MKNPFQFSHTDEIKTQELINNILKGDKTALNNLLSLHQNYIFNIAIKMFNTIEDAEDATQEVLIKIVSHLGKFDPSKAKFTTWIYRITFNHILNFKKSAPEKYELTFPKFFEFIDSLPDDEPEEETYLNETIEEARLSCTAGMLMCLSREQRLIYIVGEVFRINHNLAAEIFEISAVNFRKKLSRVRKDLYQWMHKKCGLVNHENPCRCKKKTKEFISRGIVNPDSLKWQSNYETKVREYVKNSIKDNLIATDKLYAEIHQNIPFKKSLKAGEVIDTIVQDKDFSKLIDPF